MAEEKTKPNSSKVDRRSFLTAAASVAAVPLLGSNSYAQIEIQGNPTGIKKSPAETKVSGTRKLGSLEVSSVGIGVQNMHCRYETTVPYRPEMISILRAAYDRGITFFDTAEAYGPFENERILGEAIQPFRNNIRITSKFGWNIDQETSEKKSNVVPIRKELDHYTSPSRSLSSSSLSVNIPKCLRRPILRPQRPFSEPCAIAVS